MCLHAQQLQEQSCLHARLRILNKPEMQTTSGRNTMTSEARSVLVRFLQNYLSNPRKYTLRCHVLFWFFFGSSTSQLNFTCVTMEDKNTSKWQAEA